MGVKLDKTTYKQLVIKVSVFSQQRLRFQGAFSKLVQVV